jgi:hypothetical protein
MTFREDNENIVALLLIFIKKSEIYLTRCSQPL